MLLFHLHNDLANLLRSDEAREEIRSQILEALDSNTLALRVGEIVTQIRSEGRAAIDRLKCNSKDLCAEQAAALAREAERLRGGMESQLVVFLQSNGGQELLLRLLREAIAGREVALLTEDVEARLKEVAANEVAALVTHAETAIKKSSADKHALLQRKVEAFERRADEMGGALIDRVLREADERLQEEREKLIAWSFDEVRRRLADFIDYEVPTALHDAVERHVSSGPRFVRPHSNRWLAAELGISLREVKRRRRRGELRDCQYPDCQHYASEG